jgi:hypothetical protein
MTWDEVHRRRRVTRDVLSQVEQHGDAAPVASRMAEIAAIFGSFELFLRHLEHIWTLETHVRIDSALERGTGTDRDEICKLVAQQEPGIALVLEAYADHPALRESPVTRAMARISPMEARPMS